MLRPLILEIASAFVHLQHEAVLLPASTTISVPECMPGCDLTGMLEQALRELPSPPGRIAILQETLWASPVGADIALKFGVLDGEAAVRDRWIVVGIDVPGELPARPVSLADLRDRVIRLPALPGDLAERVMRIAARAGARVQRTTESLLDLLTGSTGPQGSVTLLPALLVNRSLFTASHRWLALQEDIDDPRLALVCRTPDPSRQAMFLSLLGHIDRLSRNGTRYRQEIAELPHALSLKYCVSFCRLYEERNIRRAAERLCIVQPALTVQLHRIEEHLGKALFERSSRGIRPNAIADRLYAMLHDPVEQLLRSVQLLPGRMPPGRKLRVGIMPLLDDESRAAVGVARALDCWSRDSQREASLETGIEVTEAFSGTLVRWLQAGTGRSGAGRSALRRHGTAVRDRGDGQPGRDRRRRLRPAAARAGQSRSASHPAAWCCRPCVMDFVHCCCSIFANAAGC